MGCWLAVDGYLNPKGYATRAETAQIFYNSQEVLSTPVDDPTLDRVWVVDVPGHYETVERQELVEVTVGEEGHWEDIMVADPVFGDVTSVILLALQSRKSMHILLKA